MPNIRLIPSGVPGLDAILGGGFPEYSFNLVVGGPGVGKTTLMNQILFSNATEDRRALFITLAGEPPIKMLRYQQQFSFFDPQRVGRAVHFLNLEAEAMAGDTAALLNRIEEELKRVDPAFVAVDSLGTVEGLRTDGSAERRDNVSAFVRRLGTRLTRREATTFLVGEFNVNAIRADPIQTQADGTLRLSMVLKEDLVSRKMEVVKQRGLRQVPGLHPFRISGEGIRVYMLASAVVQGGGDRASPAAPDRLSFGVASVDEITEGGVPAGDALMISGPSGVGKSILGMHFVQAGLDAGERVVVALFEEDPQGYCQRAAKLGLGFQRAWENGRLRLFHQPLPDLSVSEAFVEVGKLADEAETRRIVFDSLTGLEVSVSDPSTRRVQEAMYRSAKTLSRQGITIALISEVSLKMNVLQLTPHRVSTLADDLILLRYVEIMGELEKVMTVVKMRRSGHSRLFYRYEIQQDGIHVGRALRDFHGVLTGVPRLTREPAKVFGDKEEKHSASHPDRDTDQSPGASK